MSRTCPASSKLALSTVLRGVFRAETASGLQLSSSAFYARENPFLPRSYFYSRARLGPRRHLTSSSTLSTSPSAESPTDSRLADSVRGGGPAPVKRQKDEVDALINTGKISTEDYKTPLETEGASDSVAASSSLTTETKQPESTKKKRARSEKQSNSKQKAESSGEKNHKLPEKKKKREPWQIYKEALKNKFKEGWAPPKKLSPDAIDGIRHLHATSPEQFTTPVLAEQFKVSPEAIRRILKSKWRPTESEMDDRRKRWQRRHDRIWSQMAELGLRPKKPIDENLSDVASLYDHKEGKKPM
ncbi:mitochondrion organization and biogenesis protein, putative [Paecilomyces variotii No. 5]|uniref:Required for respiratory growth protein 9, mitochondrial n=1 Tax=Byssochlamys spectabilis (strain No. 5 / NBRC 109023) TaxID=1356009 RepID=V5FCB5_BYSSN|nr:mitochondrion organization and biogenesis protein, putative [Paecilomyces variotii No. 5]